MQTVLSGALNEYSPGSFLKARSDHLSKERPALTTRRRTAFSSTLLVMPVVRASGSKFHLVSLVPRSVQDRDRILEACRALPEGNVF